MPIDAHQITLTVDEVLYQVPLCPHCDKPLNRISSVMLTAQGRASSRFGKRFLYSCCECNRALGISHRKGFWMG